ncbi:hypothetical protein [Aphanothece sacrum]|uniref:Cobyric acid synthase n=1 Tax=Aphanothece sacrum FPU1 TaxID=1920663 RepID=A0A401IED8_APHSA|nr:hypothetical protein [Aphanothece sacrum]GBF79604.1 cobyric acid synthase [Aphanothece sacrum FPU1]GBF87064.1 cobyric acid synthase [Aphanothece sacrum FPU3]
MRIIQTKGKIHKGELRVKAPPEFSDGEVDLVIIAKNELDDFEEMCQLAKSNGYESLDKKMELIQQVKLEMLAEKGRTK